MLSHGKGDERLTVVYLDSLLLLNMGLDALLLRAAARLSRAGTNWRRTLLAAALGAVYAAAVLLLPWPWLSHPLTRLIAAAAMARLCSRRATLSLLLLFLLLSCALAGVALGLTLTGVGSMSHGALLPVTLTDGRFLLLCGAVTYVACAVAARLLPMRKTRTVPVLLCCQGRRVLLRALVDTGNLLQDPLSGKGVPVVYAGAAELLLPVPCRDLVKNLSDPETVFTALAEQWNPGRVRLLPFRSVGTGKGLLLAIRLDWLEVDGQRLESRLAALSPDPFPSGCQVLIGTEEGGIL